MGYMSHHAIIVTDLGYGDLIDRVHSVAVELFSLVEPDDGAMVSPILLAPVNGHRSFFIAPDGSKEGWDTSDRGDEARARFREYLHSLEDNDSSPLSWVEIQYGDDNLETIIIDDSDATQRQSQE